MAAGCMGCCQLHEMVMSLSGLHLTPLPEEGRHEACKGRRTLPHHLRRLNFARAKLVLKQLLWQHSLVALALAV